MHLSEHLRQAILDAGWGDLKRKSWIIRLCSHGAASIDTPMRERQNILGISPVFRLPASGISFEVIQTGIVDHAVMTCVAKSITEQLKKITKQLSEMRKVGKSEEEMLTVISSLDLESPQEFAGDFIILRCGNFRADLNMSNTTVIAGSTITIDVLDIK